jgi:hypothetical protein
MYLESDAVSSYLAERRRVCGQEIPRTRSGRTLIFAVSALDLLVSGFLYLSLENPGPCRFVESSRFQNMSSIDPVVMPPAHDMFLQVGTKLELPYRDLPESIKLAGAYKRERRRQHGLPPSRTAKRKTAWLSFEPVDCLPNEQSETSNSHRCRWRCICLHRLLLSAFWTNGRSSRGGTWQLRIGH